MYNRGLTVEVQCFLTTLARPPIFASIFVSRLPASIFPSCKCVAHGIPPGREERGRQRFTGQGGVRTSTAQSLIPSCFLADI
jgi:hypothetical protein